MEQVMTSQQAAPRPITLATLREATPQQVFDQAARHLLTQGRKAADPYSPSCYYRMRDGRQCAAGCFIGDDEYRPWMEGLNWSAMTRHKEVPDAHVALISRLQHAHDRASDDRAVDDFREGLREVAARSYLSAAVLDEFPQ